MPRTTSPPQLPESGSVDMNRDYGKAFKRGSSSYKIIKKGFIYLKESWSYFVENKAKTLFLLQ